MCRCACACGNSQGAGRSGGHAPGPRGHRSGSGRCGAGHGHESKIARLAIQAMEGRLIDASCCGADAAPHDWQCRGNARAAGACGSVHGPGTCVNHRGPCGGGGGRGQKGGRRAVHQAMRAQTYRGGLRPVARLIHPLTIASRKSPRGRPDTQALARSWVQCLQPLRRAAAGPFARASRASE